MRVGGNEAPVSPLVPTRHEIPLTHTHTLTQTLTHRNQAGSRMAPSHRASPLWAFIKHPLPALTPAGILGGCFKNES